MVTTPTPPRFYCWTCDQSFATWPHEKTGEVRCKWCESHDCYQLVPRSVLLEAKGYIESAPNEDVDGGGGR